MPALARAARGVPIQARLRRQRTNGESGRGRVQGYGSQEPLSQGRPTSRDKVHQLHAGQLDELRRRIGSAGKHGTGTDSLYRGRTLADRTRHAHMYQASTFWYEQPLLACMESSGKHRQLVLTEDFHCVRENFFHASQKFHDGLPQTFQFI